MNRKEFLKMWGPIAGFFAMSAGPSAVYMALGGPKRCDYQPVGYISTDSPGAVDVGFVTVDGERVEHVSELDDVEGWVRYYGPNPAVEGDALRTFHRTGTVRVHWRTKQTLAA